MEVEYVRKGIIVSMTHLSDKSYKNTRKKDSDRPLRGERHFCAEMGLERAAPVFRPVQKVSGGHFLARGRVPWIWEASVWMRIKPNMYSHEYKKSGLIAGLFYLHVN